MTLATCFAHVLCAYPFCALFDVLAHGGGWPTWGTTTTLLSSLCLFYPAATAGPNGGAFFVLFAFTAARL